MRITFSKENYMTETESIVEKIPELGGLISIAIEATPPLRVVSISMDITGYWKNHCFSNVVVDTAPLEA